MKKLMSTAKVALLGAALFVTSIGFLPKAAEAWVLTIYCSGSSSHCSTVFVDGWVIDIDLGDFEGATFEPFRNI